MCQFGRVKVFAWYVSRLVANAVKQKKLLYNVEQILLYHLHSYGQQKVFLVTSNQASLTDTNHSNL